MKPRPVFDFLNSIRQWDVLAAWSRYRSRNLVRLLGVSERSVQRFFSQKFGRSIQAQLDVLRQLKAEALARSGMPAKCIVGELGFKTVPHFSRQFRKHHPMSFRPWVAERETW